MPPPTNTDRINNLQEQVLTLVHRVDGLRDEVAPLRQIDIQTREIDKQVALLDLRLKHLEKRLDEILLRRWELGKIILAAFVGGVLTLALGWINKAVERQFAGDPASSPPATAAAKKDAAPPLQPQPRER